MFSVVGVDFVNFFLVIGQCFICIKISKYISLPSSSMASSRPSISWFKQSWSLVQWLFYMQLWLKMYTNFMNVSNSWRVYVKTKITRNLLNYLKLSHNGILCN